MAEETFALDLGGRKWDIPHLPFRVLKKVQPKLVQRGSALLSGGLGAALLRFDEAMFDDLADVVVMAVRHVDPEFTLKEFEGLPVKSAELIAALPALMKACGLELRDPDAEVETEKKA